MASKENTGNGPSGIRLKGSSLLRQFGRKDDTSKITDSGSELASNGGETTPDNEDDTEPPLSVSYLKKLTLDSGQGNVTGSTVERGNALQFLFRSKDKADENEVRCDSDEEKHKDESHTADEQRKLIILGKYDEPNVGSYFGDADAVSQSLYEDKRSKKASPDITEQSSEIGQNASTRTPTKSKSQSMSRRPEENGVENEKSELDLEDPHNSFKRRFSKLVGTPTSLNFNYNSHIADTRWKDFKSSLLAFKKRDRPQSMIQKDVKRDEIDREMDEKTKQRAEFLISSLIAGAPAALFASSIFLRDERGTQRAPLLLSLLGFELVDITENPRHKHKTYRIQLEYGLSPNRLKWSIIKDSRDFLLLHSRLKVLFFQSNAFSKKDVDIPKLPRWDQQAKAAKKRLKHYDQQDNNLRIERSLSPLAGEQSFAPQSANHSQRNNDGGDNASIGSMLTRTSTISHQIRNSVSNLLTRVHSNSIEKDSRWLSTMNELYKEAMENYLTQLTIILALRPQSNRVFQFLELSPIGVLLSSENGYQGKQGYLLVRSSAKSQGWRVGHLKFRELKDMVQRHTNKWFLVRNSYILYVDDIYSTTPLEVFLVDSSFTVDFTGAEGSIEKLDDNSEDEESLYDDPRESNEVKKKSPYLVLKLQNSERKMQMIVKSEKQLNLWLTSIRSMMTKTIWSEPKRFNSFAPIRSDCFAQWFVDARDYMWACSSALEMAKETIYIHDWWLSPELYMRRPANGNQEWRLDRILKRKAEQGVKIFVIIYRNVGNTVVTDSSWTKHSLLDLHQNIYVIRSPNQLLQNTYFWAHHEKLCIIDSTVCFLGGIDLCFGRFDTPDHVLADDAPTLFPESDHKNTPKSQKARFQYFPGKDYSNPRVKDFFSLDKPYESMYDRQKVPRMPWHDVHMVSAGQVARDLSRHFVQRWNYLLRQKRPSRPTPLLLPPSDLTPEEVKEMGLDGTCEIQLLRSSGSWSLGLKEHEQSIQDAYLKVIETSEHFVYLENQFFITSTEFDGTVIKNRIGDALVDRIIRAHHDGKRWRAVIVIPLMPGFESQVSEADGSSVRVIMQCQFMSISRGPTSIFAKLRKVGIDPDDYIQFFSLRKWGRIGQHGNLVTEQLYIHAKTLMADDRIAIIGSANINERSMRGDRDSEVAAIVRDKEMVKTTMNGKPYLAGRFAHTLRMRLMREHLGVDVDMLELVERRFNQLETLAKSDIGKLLSTGKFSSSKSQISSAMVELGTREVLNKMGGSDRWLNFVKATGEYIDLDASSIEKELKASLEETTKFKPQPLFHSFNYRAGVENLGMRDKKKFSSDSRIHNNKEHKDDIAGLGKDKYKSSEYDSSHKNVNKVIKDWAKEAIDPNDTFLPNIEQVLGYLNDDGVDYDNDFSKTIDEEDQRTLDSKNRDRWLFLKRISYLQRCVGKKMAKNLELEAPTTLNKSNTKESATDSKSNFGVGGSGNGETPAVSLSDQDIEDALAALDCNNHMFIDPYGFEDPLDEEFYEDVWFSTAMKNTRLFRMIFHCQPDNVAETWADYTKFYNLEADFEKLQRELCESKDVSQMGNGADEKKVETPPLNNGLGVLGFHGGDRDKKLDYSNSDSSVTDNSAPTTSTPTTSNENGGGSDSENSEKNPEMQDTTDKEATMRRRRRAGVFASRHRNATFGETVYDKATAEKILSHIQGHVVVFPADWLHKELEKGGSWFFNADRLPPIEIYD